MILILSLLIPLPGAEAKQKRSGSSRLESSGMQSCVETAINGSQEGECSTARPNTEACVGLRKALELSQQKSKCLVPRGISCQEWGHEGKTQAQWISIAAAHLAKFGVCIRSAYGDENQFGLKEALADQDLIDSLRKLDDGSKFLGYKEATILLRSLEGDRFGYILEKSPYARELASGELYLFREAADTPAVLEQELAQEESLAVWEIGSFGGRQPATWNPSEAKPLAKAKPKQWNPVATGNNTVEAIPTELSQPGSQRAVSNQRLQNNPYTLGLDRSLFERVSSAYMKRAASLKGFDDFIRIHQPPPPKDLGELLTRGGTL